MSTHDLAQTAPAFVEMAHRIVWASVASVDRHGRPRSRILHPVWTWDGQELTGWVGTRPTSPKRAHLQQSPYLSCSYWSPNHDNCIADCHAEILEDDDTRIRVWHLLKDAPEPVGYNPAIVPGWETPTSPAFGALRLSPWQLRVFPGTVLLRQGGEVLVWEQSILPIQSNDGDK
jgi:hypothetical protein